MISVALITAALLMTVVARGECKPPCTVPGPLSAAGCWIPRIALWLLATSGTGVVAAASFVAALHVSLKFSVSLPVVALDIICAGGRGLS